MNPFDIKVHELYCNYSWQFSLAIALRIYISTNMPQSSGEIHQSKFLEITSLSRIIKSPIPSLSLWDYPREKWLFSNGLSTKQWLKKFNRKRFNVSRNRKAFLNITNPYWWHQELNEVRVAVITNMFTVCLGLFFCSQIPLMVQIRKIYLKYFSTAWINRQAYETSPFAIMLTGCV